MGLASDLPALLVAVPIAGACALLALGRLVARRAIDSLALAVALACTALAAMLLRATDSGTVVSWVGGWRPAPHATVGIVLAADRLGGGMVVLIWLLTTVALGFGWRYFDNIRAHYPALVLLFAAGMTGFTLTGDLFDMFVFFELMGVAAYALTGLEIEEPESVQAGLNFGVINSLGAYLCLFGIGLLYARTGQLGLPQLGAALAGGGRDRLVLIAFALIATGWLVKAAVVPFHFWLADAHAVAPSPVCVLFSGVMAPLGVYGLLRVYWVAFDGALPRIGVQRTLMILGVVTAVLGTVMCLLQRHIKRLLAYSTIAHIGLFLLGAAALTARGVAASALYLAGHAAVKGALFLMAGILLSHYGKLDEHGLYGQARRHRVNGVLFVLAAAMLAGLPPSGTGLGKQLLEEACHGVGWTVLVTAVSALTGGAVLRVGLRVYFGLGRAPQDDSAGEETTGARKEPESATPGDRTPVTMVVAVVTLLVVAVLLGLPNPLTSAVGRAAAEFVDTVGYRDRAMLRFAAPPVRGGPGVDWTAEGLALGTLSAVLAVVVAAVALYSGSWLTRIVFRGAPVEPVVRTLHRVHSGHLGDYAAWLVFGTALITGILATGW